VGWHLAIRVFLPGITQERRLKPPGLDLIRGIRSCLILWRGMWPSWLSPAKGGSGSTQILTQHCGVKSQTISHVVNSETAPSGQELVVQSLWVIETPVYGVSAQAAPPSNKEVHMELSIRLSFQLRRSLGGYTVGTTMGFQVKTVEALAPQPHHRIPSRRPQ
jgi:hypothetical protein